MPDNLIIRTQPEIWEIEEELGFCIDSGDTYEYQILKRQKDETEIFEIKPGQRFIINADFGLSVIITNGKRYTLFCNLTFPLDTKDFEKEENNIILYPGTYLFHEDGVSVELISYGITY